MTGEQHDDATRKGTRDAVLYAVSLSSAVFLPTVIGGGDAAQRPPACRALVGRQLVETLWLERLAEAITHHAAGMQPTETTRKQSILGHFSRKRRARFASSSTYTLHTSLPSLCQMAHVPCTPTSPECHHRHASGPEHTSPQ